MANDPAARPDDNAHLIVVEDHEVPIEHHVENWLAFAVFWALGLIVFLQFFTRYVLNDSLAWTEEIARYGLIWVTFIGAAIVARKNMHIAVDAVLLFLSPVPARILLAVVDIIKLLFIGLLAYFSLTIVERMQWQRMVIIDLPMSIVYGGVALGCFLMLMRQAINFFRNARDGWRTSHKALTEGMIE